MLKGLSLIVYDCLVNLSIHRFAEVGNILTLVCLLLTSNDFYMFLNKVSRGETICLNPLISFGCERSLPRCPRSNAFETATPACHYLANAERTESENMTDRQTDGRTDGQILASLYAPFIRAGHNDKWLLLLVWRVRSTREQPLMTQRHVIGS